MYEAVWKYSVALLYGNLLNYKTIFNVYKKTNVRLGVFFK